MKIFIVLTGVLLTVCSCSKKSTFMGEQSELILSGQVAFDGNTQPNASVSKSADGQLDPLPATDLGVYVLTVSGSVQTDFMTTMWKNESFISDASGNISGGNVTLRTGTTYDIYAYAPRVAGLSDVHTVPVNHGDDVLWACTPGTVATAGGTKAKLAFTHCGAQIGFRLKTSDGSTDLTGAKLIVSGFCKTGTLDVATGAMTATDPTQTLTDYSGERTNILITGGMMTFSVTVKDVPGRSEPFTGSFSRVLQPGKSYLYDVIINMDGEQVTLVGEVVDWVNIVAPDPLPAG